MKYNGKMGDGMREKEKKGRTAAKKMSEETKPKGSGKMQNEVMESYEKAREKNKKRMEKERHESENGKKSREIRISTWE